jgi:hypothetical protein
MAEVELPEVERKILDGDKKIVGRAICFHLFFSYFS